MSPGGIRTHNLSRLAPADLRLRPPNFLLYFGQIKALTYATAVRGLGCNGTIEEVGQLTQSSPIRGREVAQEITGIIFLKWFITFHTITIPVFFKVLSL